MAKASARMVAATLRMVACACAVECCYSRVAVAQHASLCCRPAPPTAAAGVGTAGAQEARVAGRKKTDPPAEVL